jgi:WD40 repeat protein
MRTARITRSALRHRAPRHARALQVGRASHIWSLTGNSTPIECVCFDHQEESLFSGSSGGAVKQYDLTAGRVSSGAVLLPMSH